MDLVVSNHGPDGGPGNAVSVLLNNGDGTFMDAVPYSSAGYVSSVFAADLNGDGYPDLAVGHDYSNFSILFNNESGAFGSPTDFTLHSPRAVFAADLEGDGDQDLAVASLDDGVYVFKNNGTGTFTKEGPFPIGSQPISIFVADLDGDGDQDIVTANYNGDNLSILWNDGHGVFSAGPVLTTDSHPVFVFISDLNRDGRPDLIVSYSYTNAITVFLNNGNGIFSAEPDYSTSKPVLSVVAADFDGDGFPDVAAPLTGYPVTDGSAIAIFQNNGDGTFATTPQVFPTNAGPWAVFASDFDGDGDLDVAVTNAANNNISVLLNLGNVSAAPDPPMVSAVLDAGTGDKLVVKWSAPLNSSNITDYQIGWGPATNNYPNSKIVAADGHSNYRVEIDNLQAHTSYFVAVRSRNANTVRMSGWAMAHNPDTAVNATIPVVLAHGWDSDPSIWGDKNSGYVKWLHDAGFPHVWVCDLIYPCGAPGEEEFTQNAELFSKFIEDSIKAYISHYGTADGEYRNIEVISHSMGGLIARRYISGSQSETWANKRKVRDLVMLETPNNGTSTGDMTFLLVPLCIFDCAPASCELGASEMKKFNSKYHNRRGTKYHTVSGTAGTCDKPQPPSIGCGPKLNWSTWNETCPNDGIVSVESSEWLFSVDADEDPTTLGERQITSYYCHSGVDAPYHDKSLATSFIVPIINSFSATNEQLPGVSGRLSITSSTPPQFSFTKCDSILSGQVMTDSLNSESGVLGISMFTADSTLSFFIESPTGKMWDSTTVASDSSVIYSATAHERGFVFQNAEQGRWFMHFNAQSLSSSSATFCLLAVQKNDIVFRPSVSASYPVPGNPIFITAVLTDNTVPITEASVTALPIHAKRDTLSLITLFDDGNHNDGSTGDGVYGGKFDQPLDSGLITFDLVATGLATSVGSFRREAIMSSFVTLGVPICGDINRDRQLTPADVVSELNCVFLGASCLFTVADVNGDGLLTPADVVVELNAVFLGNPTRCSQ